MVLTNTEYAFTAVMGSPVAGESEPTQNLPNPPRRLASANSGGWEKVAGGKYLVWVGKTTFVQVVCASAARLPSQSAVWGILDEVTVDHVKDRSLTYGGGGSTLPPGPTTVGSRAG